MMRHALRRRRWQGVLSANVDPTTISLVVDLGCDTGRFSEVLAAEFDARVTGSIHPRKLSTRPDEDGNEPCSYLGGRQHTKWALSQPQIRIDADGTITVFTGKAELDQGLKTALIQLAAEELVVEPVSARPTPPAIGQPITRGYTIVLIRFVTRLARRARASMQR